MSKFTIYQVLPRLFGNHGSNNKVHGTITENGCGKFSFFSDKVLHEIKSIGITHVWYTGVLEHATQTDYTAFGIQKDHPGVVKGKAGSPYAIKDYYDVDPDLADNVCDRMNEFEQLINRTHEAGMKVIIDFVPNHVAREYASDVKPIGVRDLGEDDLSTCAFHSHNNFYYIPDQRFQPEFDIAGYEENPAKATGNDCFSPSPSKQDWYETIKLNYGVDYWRNKETHFHPIPDTWYKMRDILLFWASKEIDGFRCDMAEMVPVEFWHWVIGEVKTQYPDLIFIAEVYNPQEYRTYIFQGGFDYLYDKVGMYDLLRNIICHNHSAASITNAWQSLAGIEDQMLHFLENHDEQRIASDFFAGDPWVVLPAVIVSATLTKAPLMIYAGQELGERGMDAEGYSGLDGRTTIFDYWGVKTFQKWANKGKVDGKLLSEQQQQLRSYYQKLLNLCIHEPAISKGVMYDLQYANLHNPAYNPHTNFAYLRMYANELLLIVVNFDVISANIAVIIPSEAFAFFNLPTNMSGHYVDLLNESYASQIEFGADKPVEILVSSNSGRILKFSV